MTKVRGNDKREQERWLAMNSNRKISSRRIGRAYGRGVGGTTLIEMLVAIAVTIIMMAVAGVVFKNAIDASGSATATGEMMATARGIIQQLERDFKGLRADLPMAIIFEEGVYRHDRIVFFADGDFQVPYQLPPPGLSGNLARIFYGQTTNNAGEYGWLARRFKIMTADTGWPLLNLDPSTNGWATSELYDYTLFERATAADWKNLSSSASNSISGFPGNFANYYFNDEWHIQNGSRVYNAEVSFIQRPNVNKLTTGEAVQQLYMAGYIGEFKIEVPVGSLPPGYGTGNTWSAPVYDPGFDFYVSRALYWNVDDMDTSTTEPVKIYRVPGNSNIYTKWYGTNDLVVGLLIKWPEALKFTFTLYEKNVKYYPDGQTFSYIVKLNQPAK